MQPRSPRGSLCKLRRFTCGDFLTEAFSKCIDQWPICQCYVNVPMNAGCCTTSVESTLDHFLELVDFTFGHVRNGILRASLARLRSIPEMRVSADQALSYRRRASRGN